MSEAEDRVTAYDELRREIEACQGCPLHATRTQAVPGEGDLAADLMFVGEAPGYHEDQQGRPFVGQAGKLLGELLAAINLTREQVFIANVLKSRPPNNRDPQPDEISACRPFLYRQIELIRPKVICTLGNHATKLLSGNPAGITRVHGKPQAVEMAGVTLWLYPIFHPAAALYTRSMLTTLQDDFARLPELLAQPRPTLGSPSAAPADEARVSQTDDSAPAAPSAAEPVVVDGEAPGPAAAPQSAEGASEQLGLF